MTGGQKEHRNGAAGLGKTRIRLEAIGSVPVHVDSVLKCGRAGVLLFGAETLVLSNVTEKRIAGVHMGF